MDDVAKPERGAATDIGLTQLLQRAGRGEQAAKEALLDRVHSELRRIAQVYMSAERTGHTLQATALVHEAYLRLFGNANIPWADRGHFYAAAADAMRRILIDHARKRNRIKRGGGDKRLPAHVMDLVASEDPSNTLAVDDAICRLQADDPRAATVVRLRFFAGLSLEETANAMQLSVRTVAREWSYARAWLYRVLADPDT